MTQDSLSGASVYKHNQESVQRPDVGVEAQFSNEHPAEGPREQQLAIVARRVVCAAHHIAPAQLREQVHVQLK